MEIEAGVSDDPREKFNRIEERLEGIREKMEIETHIFVEATGKFTLEWVKREREARREVEITMPSADNEISQENSKYNNQKLIGLDSDFKELSIRISDIVEAHLNQAECWTHRNILPQAGVSREYIEFRKEKIRKEIASRIRIILGCASEVSDDLKEGSEGKIWVIERGRRKYACFLRFSDEMTASLNRYLEKLEEFLILEHEMKVEMAKIDGKISEEKKSDTT